MSDAGYRDGRSGCGRTPTVAGLQWRSRVRIQPLATAWSGGFFTRHCGNLFRETV